MSDRTPGPWTVAGDAMVYGPRFSIGDPKKQLGLVEVADCKGYKKERDANALLIAAAPDLLAVLQQIVEDTNKYIESGDSDSFKDWMLANCEDAERAIAKAKGGAL